MDLYNTDNKVNNKGVFNSIKNLFAAKEIVEPTVELGQVRGLSYTIEVVKSIALKDNSPNAMYEYEVVGYVIKNKGNKQLNLETEVYNRNNKDASGKYIPTRKHLKIKPNSSQILTLKDTVSLSSRIEYSMEFGNGGFKRKKYKKGDSDIFDRYYFIFFNGMKSIYDNDIRIDIGEINTVMTNGVPIRKYSLLDRYFEVFGYLENKTTVTEKEEKGNTVKIHKFVRELLNTHKQYM